jgi:hypothetical protein
VRSSIVETRAGIERLLSKKLALKVEKDVPGDVVYSYLFDKQRALATDPHRFITACCGRRAGKTIGAAAMMLRAAKEHPKRVVLYATLTKGTAKLIIWDTLKDLNTLFGLGGAPNESELTMRMPNGALIVLVGIDKKREIEKRRGLGFALVVIDECQSIPEYVKNLIDDVIGPALIDVPGRLLMLGTPSLLASGYWYQCHHNKNEVWGHHSWTCFENPKLPDPHASLAAECARRGVNADDASIQREWFARWVRDLLSAVFAFDPAKNTFTEKPRELKAELWRYIISVDLGGGVERDNDAISVLAYHPHHRATWLVEEHVKPKQDVTAICKAVLKIQGGLGALNVDAVVVDTGGIGAKVALEMARRYHLGVLPAKKSEKWANIELLNAACRHGEFFAKKDGWFALESPKVEKDWDKSTPEKIEIKGHMPDICDSVLYGYVESLSWISKAPVQEPERGSKEWVARQQRAMFEHTQREVMKAKQGAADDWGGEMDDWGAAEWK